VLAAICSTAAFSQAQKEPPTVRDYCVKVAPGKSMEFEAYAHDVAVPLSQVRADAGEFDWFLVARGVIPAGSSAACDYRVVYGYKGFPPESPSNDQIEAAIKKAGLRMSAKELFARRDALSQLVDVAIWQQIDSVGPPAQKGSYIRLNHYSVNPKAMDDWVRLETTHWKPLVDTWVKGGAKGSWGVYQLWMPGGDNQPYNALTVDIFPDWNSLLHGLPVGELWPKVHPNTDQTAVFDQLDGVRSRHDIEVVKVIELVAPAAR